jgi:hypothetical protein
VKLLLHLVGTIAWHQQCLQSLCATFAALNTICTYLILHCSMAARSASLLESPDTCLPAVLQYLADDPASLCSAARGHSRLRQAAAAALTSITAGPLNSQQAGSMQQYLRKHRRHVSSVSLKGVDNERLSKRLAMYELPASKLQLHTLELECWRLQLLPGGRFKGVLGPASHSTTALKQLRLNCCTVMDGIKGLAAALSQLTGLPQLTGLSTSVSTSSNMRPWPRPTPPVHGLQSFPPMR